MWVEMINLGGFGVLSHFYKCGIEWYHRSEVGLPAHHQALVLVLQCVAFVFDPEEDQVGQKSEHHDETHVLVALDLYYLVGQPLPSQL